MTPNVIISNIGAVLESTAMFDALPGSCILLQNNAPHYTVLAATPEYLAQTGYKKEAIIGKGVFEMSPANPDDPTDTGVKNLRASLEMVRLHKKPHQLPVQRYDIAGEDGCFSERYWSASNRPILSPEGEVAYIIHTAEDITSQVKEEAKDQAHQELQFVTDTMPQLVWASEANGYSYFFNKGWLDYTGFTLEEVKGNGWTKSLHPDDLDRTMEAWTHAYSDGAAYEIEYRLKRHDGEYRWFLTRGTPMKDEQGNILRWYGTTTDVHEQKQAQEALLQSTERFNLVSKATQDAIWDWNIITDEVVWNEGVQQLFGYSSENLIVHADWWYDHVHPEDRDHSVSVLQQVFENGGSSCTREYRFQCADGLYKNVFDRGFIQRNEAGKPVRMIGSMQDITERKQMEAILRDSEAQFRFMVNTVPLSIWITDAEGNVEFLNQHWCDYCGLPYSQTTAANVSAKHIHPDDGPEVMKVFGAAMLTEESWEIEQRNLSKEGEFRWFLNRGTPYKDPHTGKVLKWFGISIDIHERKLEQQALQRSEEELEKKVQERTLELEKANQELKRSNRNLEEFAYAASHDLKEPVRKIHVFSERLKDSLSDKLNENERHYFQRMELASQRMGTLIDDLLNYSEVSQESSLDETIDMNQLMEQVLSDLDLEIEQKEAIVNVSQLFVMKGHKRQLQQAFYNLIGNALKYSKPGVPPEVSIECQKVKGSDTALPFTPAEQDKEFYQLTVTDNGIGFEQADAERIFNVFTRLHGMAEYKGTGVGLSIVRKIIENHHGYIWAEAQPAKGASFNVLLPANLPMM